MVTSHLSSAKVMNEWMCTSHPSICLHSVDRDSFTFHTKTKNEVRITRSVLPKNQIRIFVFSQPHRPTLGFPLFSVIPPVLHTHLHLHVILTRTNGRSLGTYQNQFSFGNRGVLDGKVLSLSQHFDLKGHICYMSRVASYTAWRTGDLVRMGKVTLYNEKTTWCLVSWLQKCGTDAWFNWRFKCIWIL
jgi:hypothetical protein